MKSAKAAMTALALESTPGANAARDGVTTTGDDVDWTFVYTVAVLICFRSFACTSSCARSFVCGELCLD